MFRHISFLTLSSYLVMSLSVNCLIAEAANISGRCFLCESAKSDIITMSNIEFGKIRGGYGYDLIARDIEIIGAGTSGLLAVGCILGSGFFTDRFLTEYHGRHYTATSAREALFAGTSIACLSVLATTMIGVVAVITKFDV